ncbi:MAG: putative transport system permease protein [Fusobacteriaceae bacterium]|jgi:putative ABC transport system permease protein|nr:putative transport system permease protein [Fusobacteriaceae bacterium]
MIIKMAFRNIFRHKARTILTLVMIVMGIFIVIVGEGANRGLELQIIDMSIKTDVGKNKIYKKGFYAEKEDNNPIEYLIENEKEIRDILKDKAVSYRIHFNGSITNGINELGAKFYGINKQEEDSVFNRSSQIIEGHHFNKENEVIIGKDFADLLNLKLNDTITIIARTKNKTINAYDMTISGIFKTNNILIDKNVIFLERNFAKKFLEIDKINDIVIKDELSQNELNKLNKLNIEVMNYTIELEDMIETMKIKRQSMFVTSIVLLLMAGVGIINTMLMVMLERKREIGVLMANGMNRKEILLLFLSEGTAIGVIGSFIGFIFGTLLTLYYQKNGILLPEGSDALASNMPISNVFYFSYNYTISIIYLIAGIFVAAISSIYPAYKATTLEPAEVIRDY